jgi:hypothetical protein
MLGGVRYRTADEKGGGLIEDETMFEFRFSEAGRDTRFGQMGASFKGSPRLLRELGRSLMHYCAADEPQRPVMLRVVEERCQALETYLDEKNRAASPSK